MFLGGSYHDRDNPHKWGVSHDQLITFITLVCSQKEGTDSRGAAAGDTFKLPWMTMMRMKMMMTTMVFYGGTGTKCTGDKNSNPKHQPQHRRPHDAMIRQWWTTIRVSDNKNTTTTTTNNNNNTIGPMAASSDGINRWNLPKTMESNQHDDWTQTNAAAMVDDNATDAEEQAPGEDKDKGTTGGHTTSGTAGPTRPTIARIAREWKTVTMRTRSKPPQDDTRRLAAADTLVGGNHRS
jgi:hypothetical protein